MRAPAAAILPRTSEHDLAAGDRLGALHRGEALVDRGLDAGGRQLPEELARDRVADAPR